MLTDRETELRDAYLKGYEDRANYYDKLVVDRYELAERYAVNQDKNNEVLDLVSGSLWRKDIIDPLSLFKARLKLLEIKEINREEANAVEEFKTVIALIEKLDQ